MITVDELEPSQWAVGGQTLEDLNSGRKVFFVNIKISQGTSNPAEMAEMIRQTKEMMTDILGECEIANYFIIDELNPDAWGFDGISMTVRRAGK